MQSERKPKLPSKSRTANVKSFARGLQVIKTMAQKQVPLTITEVADCTGLTRAGARRLLLTLQDLGYARLDGRHFSLTPRIMELGSSYSSLDPSGMSRSVISANWSTTSTKPYLQVC